MPFLSKSAITLAASATERKSRSSCHDHEGLALVSSGKELAAGGAAGERLAAADAGILKDLGQPESLQPAKVGDALALSFEAEATIGLLVARNAEVGDSIPHGVLAYYFTPGGGLGLCEG
jgi:hypothetical protein